MEWCLVSYLLIKKIIMIDKLKHRNKALLELILTAIIKVFNGSAILLYVVKFSNYLHKILDNSRSYFVVGMQSIVNLVLP